MGVYADRILPRLVEVSCGGAGMQRWRSKAVDGLHGAVVEIGFGSGLNVPVYPTEITKVWAVEPSERARRIAQGRVDASTAEVEHVGLDGQHLPIPDDSCDGALSTFTLCTIPDPTLALGELRRVLKSGARLHVLEHGAAPEASVARWQQRIEPWQRRLAGGCHLTRDTSTMLVDAGFVDVELTSRYVKGPKPWSYFSYGTATNP